MAMTENYRMQFSSKATPIGHYMTVQEKREIRDRAMKEIYELLLKSGPHPVTVIALRVGLNKSTASKYLHYMRVESRQVRRSVEVDNLKRILWEVGEAPDLPSREE